MLSADCARIVNEFQAAYKFNFNFQFIFIDYAQLRGIQICSGCYNPHSSSTAHNEVGHSFQFWKDALSFFNVVEQLGNPFLARGLDLITALDTKNVMEQEVATSPSQIQDIGMASLHTAHVNERLLSASTSITNAIQRKNIY